MVRDKCVWCEKELSKKQLYHNQKYCSQKCCRAFRKKYGWFTKEYSKSKRGSVGRYFNNKNKELKI